MPKFFAPLRMTNFLSIAIGEMRQRAEHHSCTKTSNTFAASTSESISTYSSAAWVFPPRAPHRTAGVCDTVWKTYMSQGPSIPAIAGGLPMTRVAQSDNSVTRGSLAEMAEPGSHRGVKTTSGGVSKGSTVACRERIDPRKEFAVDVFRFFAWHRLPVDFELAFFGNRDRLFHAPRSGDDFRHDNRNWVGSFGIQRVRLGFARRCSPKSLIFASR